MFDLRVLTKIAVSAAGAAVAGGTASAVADPLSPWQVHAAAGGAALVTYLVGLWQDSPRAR